MNQVQLYYSYGVYRMDGTLKVHLGTLTIVIVYYSTINGTLFKSNGLSSRNHDQASAPAHTLALDHTPPKAVGMPSAVCRAAGHNGHTVPIVFNSHSGVLTRAFTS